jgi:hypothetical protein
MMVLAIVNALSSEEITAVGVPFPRGYIDETILNPVLNSLQEI